MNELAKVFPSWTTVLFPTHWAFKFHNVLILSTFAIETLQYKRSRSPTKHHAIAGGDGPTYMQIVHALSNMLTPLIS